MPHIIIENSSNISSELIFDLGQQITNLMSKQEGNFDIEQCKLRNISFDKYFVGTSSQSSASFVHITIKIMSGRTDLVKKNLSTKLFELIKDFFEQKNFEDFLKKRCDISLDIVDMDQNFYQKTTI